MAGLLGADPTDPSDPMAQAANMAPNFINPAYATPEQVAQLRQLAAGLMQPRPVAHWSQGLAEMADALAGNRLNSRANEQQKAALATSAQQQSPLIAMLMGQAGGQPSPAAAAANPAGGGVLSTPLAPPGSTAPAETPNNNPGNIRALGPDGSVNAWVAKQPGYQGVGKGGFAAFDTPESGTAAMAANLHSYASHGVDTLAKLTAKWAPAGDGANDPNAYAARVSAATGIDPNARIDLTDPAVVGRIIPAMTAVEQGRPMTPQVAMHPGAPTASAAPPQGGGQQSQGGLGGMSPQQISALIANPWIPDSTKQLAMALVEPKVIPGPLGSSYLYRLGQTPQMLMPGAEKGTLKLAGGTEVPTITTGTPANPETKMLIPNAAGPAAAPTGAAPGQKPGPLDALKPVNEQASQFAARKDEIVDEAKNTVDTLAKYKEAGIEAQGKTSQIDAVGQLGDKVNYGIVPWVKQYLGGHGIDTSGYTDIQAYQAAIDALAPTLRPEGSGRLLGNELTAFRGALGGLMVTPEGRQIAAQNMKLLTQYQVQMGQIAGNTSLPPDERMARIQALQPPKLVLTAGTSPSQATSPNAPQTPTGPQSASASLDDARDAITRGAPRDAVVARLRKMGIDPSGL